MLSLRYTLRTDLQPDGCRGLCPRTPEVYPLWRYPVEQWKRRHFCRRFPPFYLTACVWSLLSVATFGCIFSIVKNLRDFAFTQFVFQNRHLNASLQINAGIDAVTVSATLGHSTPTTTLNIYSHCFEENKTKSVDIVNTALGGFI